MSRSGLLEHLDAVAVTPVSASPTALCQRLTAHAPLPVFVRMVCAVPLQTFVQDKDKNSILYNHGNEYLHYQDDW